jgi:hypothetical protein
MKLMSRLFEIPTLAKRLTLEILFRRLCPQA